MGERRILWAVVGASRFAGPRRRTGSSEKDHGAIRGVGHHARRFVHVRAKRTARGPLSEVRIFSAVSDRHHVRAGTRARYARSVALQQANEDKTGRGVVLLPAPDRNALSGARP